MTGGFELKVINKPIYYIELVALLNRLVEDRAYGSLQLTEEQNHFLELLQGFRLKGRELYELYLIHENLDCVEAIEKEIHNLDQIEFLYLLFGEAFTREQLKAFAERPEAMEVSIPLGGYEYDSAGYAIEHTKEFTEKLLEVFKLLDAMVNKQLALQHIYEESIARVSRELKAKVPLDVAQGIMGKKFKRVFDFNTYYFVPSYFYANRPMRTFNQAIQLVVYPTQEANSYNKNMLANALRVIGDSTRLDIIQLLSRRPMFGKELASQLGIVTSTVSHHLEQLRSVGLIHEERDKSVKYFSLNRNEYNRICEAIQRFIPEDNVL